MLAQGAGQCYPRDVRRTEILRSLIASSVFTSRLGLYCGNAMAKIDPEKIGWIAAKVENALNKAYATIRVEPDEYLAHLRAAHGLAVQTYEGMFSVPVEQLDAVALQAIR